MDWKELGVFLDPGGTEKARLTCSSVLFTFLLARELLTPFLSSVLR